jgi:hypothetical protein
MCTRYFVLFCLGGVIELIFLGLGGGKSLFSVFSAIIIIFLSIKILGIRFINGRVIRIALGFSFIHIILGNIPIVIAEQVDRLRPISCEFEGASLSFLSAVFRGPLDHYGVFWFAQSFLFTLLFMGVFAIFSKTIRRIDNGLSSRAIQDKNS